MDLRVSRTFARPRCARRSSRLHGLIKQIDDQLGLLFRFMEDRGLLESTLIVFTSDHGDYLGDHWLGEKDLFHEPSVKVPLIICDPSAKPTRARHRVR
jgi:arylsulfatase A-like enzyme